MQLLAQLPENQQQILRTRGVMCAEISFPLPSEDGFLTWRLPLSNHVPSDTRFYIDGSAMDTDCRETCRLGFSIVAVSPNGQLRALGYGTPPSWIVDSAGAEIWAFYNVLSRCATCPPVVTDCLGILNTLREGAEHATAAMRRLARAWVMIFNILDHPSSIAHALAETTWMPAHLAQSAIGARLKSDGEPISPMDWRANRLADAAAKAGARSVRLPASLRILRERTLNAYQHALVELAAVTVAANRHEVQVVSDNGVLQHIVKRDCSAVPRAKRAKTVRSALCSSEPCAVSRSSHCALESCQLPLPDRPVTSCAKRLASPMRDSTVAKRRRMAVDHETIANAHQMDAWRSARSAKSWALVSDSHGHAADRISALRQRVLARSAASA